MKQKGERGSARQRQRAHTRATRGGGRPTHPVLQGRVGHGGEHAVEQRGPEDDREVLRGHRVLRLVLRDSIAAAGAR